MSLLLFLKVISCMSDVIPSSNSFNSVIVGGEFDDLKPNVSFFVVVASGLR